MNRQLAEKIADAVLYEGYMLYPYRPSAIKNRQRWTFGTLYPAGFEEVGRGTESARMHTECLVRANESAAINIHMRFLHLRSRQISNANGESVSSVVADGQLLESWDEGIARSVMCEIADLEGPQLPMTFHFSSEHGIEEHRNSQGTLLASVVRKQQDITGSILCSAELLRDTIYKLVIDINNETALTSPPADRNEALLRSFLSAHTILTAEHAEFISSLDPPDELCDLVGSCKNVGNFPVLVGEPGERDMLLCSPIVLYDYPQIAPESAGDFYDATEMDEMLTLRVVTLTDDEKNAMRSADDRVRALLQRTEDTAREQLARTHGAIRSTRPEGAK